MYCENCGKKLKEGNLFCEYCGASVKQDTPAAADLVQEAAEALRGGNQEAFQRIYHGTYQTVYKIARAFFPYSEQDREDCIQMAYMRIYEKIRLYNPEKGRFVPWMKMVVENVCRDEYAKIKNNKGAETSIEEMSDESGQTVEFADEEMTFNPEAQADWNETQRLLKEIIESLPEKVRQTVMLYYGGEYKQDEVARLLGVSLQTVKHRLKVGRERVEERVLTLEKRGTRLYSMAPIVFFAWLLSNDSALHTEAAQAMPFSFGYPQRGQQMYSEHMHLADRAGNASQAAANAGVATAVAGAAGKGVAVKVIAGIAAAAVIGGGTYTGVKLYQENARQEENTEIADENTGDAENAVALLETIDQEELAVQLAASCTDYENPEENTFSPDDPIDSQQLYEIYANNLYASLTGVEGSYYLTDAESISYIQEEDVSAPLSIFDQLNEVYGISDELVAQMIAEASEIGETLHNTIRYTDDTVSWYMGAPDLVRTASVDQMEQKEGIIEVDYTVSDVTVIADAAEDCQYTAVLQPKDNEFGYQIISIQCREQNTAVAKDKQFRSLDDIDSYETLAEEYGKFFYKTGEGESFLANDIGMMNPYHGMSPRVSEDYPAIYYALYDMNDDGIEECFFTSDPGTEQDNLAQGYYGIWTLVDGKPVQSAECGYHVQQYISEDGLLRSLYYGGIMSSELAYYKIGTDGKMQEVESATFYSESSNANEEQGEWVRENDARHPPREGLKFDWIEIEK